MPGAPAQTPGITLTPTEKLTTTEKGGTASFTVQLQKAPTHPVTITFTTDDTEASLSPSTLTFSNSNHTIPQTVTIRGKDDTVGDGDVKYEVSIAKLESDDPSYKNLDKSRHTVAVTNRDDDQKSPIQLGVSLGYRFIFDRHEDFSEATISPTDQTLRLDKRDRTAVVLSGALTAFPIRQVGLLVVLNLAEINDQNAGLTTPRSIEGGLGIAVRLHEKVALGITLERVFSRRVRDHFIAMDGQQLMVEGDDGTKAPLTTLDEKDSLYFRDDNLTALAFRMIFKL